MKKVFCVIALAAICSGSVFAYSAPVEVKTTLAADTVKKKIKTKNNKTKTKVKTKKDTVSKM